MMMMLRTSVECSAKIAMTALLACRATTGLLPDLGQTRRIFLMGAPCTFFGHTHSPLHDVVIEAAMEQ
jgi:hypothetical protein